MINQQNLKKKLNIGWMKKIKVIKQLKLRIYFIMKILNNYFIKFYF